MILRRAVLFDEVIWAWLASEWTYTVRKVPGADRRLIDAANFRSAKENAARRALLDVRRGNLLDALPATTAWSLVQLQRKDIPLLSILPSFDWYLDTGGTFRLLDTRTHLCSGHGYVDEHGTRQPILHEEHVRDILRKRTARPADWAAEPIVIVAATTGGPWTIIDGTHRASAYLRTAMDAPLAAYRGYSRLMRRYGWHIESAGARKRIARARRYIAKGEVW
ncbi:MAG: hypothetical protein HY341_00850 [Candidatus Kerfeldbacteria bacterium]|nr:hypothetical protein [Candidatus Kerfeldbacteria bacterium]